jgi:hypothetical protein
VRKSDPRMAIALPAWRTDAAMPVTVTDNRTGATYEGARSTCVIVLMVQSRTTRECDLVRANAANSDAS